MDFCISASNLTPTEGHMPFAIKVDENGDFYFQSILDETFKFIMPIKDMLFTFLAVPYKGGEDGDQQIALISKIFHKQFFDDYRRSVEENLRDGYRGFTNSEIKIEVSKDCRTATIQVQKKTLTKKSIKDLKKNINQALQEQIKTEKELFQEELEALLTKYIQGSTPEECLLSTFQPRKVALIKDIKGAFNFAPRLLRHSAMRKALKQQELQISYVDKLTENFNKTKENISEGIRKEKSTLTEEQRKKIELELIAADLERKKRRKKRQRPSYRKKTTTLTTKVSPKKHSSPTQAPFSSTEKKVHSVATSQLPPLVTHLKIHPRVGRWMKKEMNKEDFPTFNEEDLKIQRILHCLIGAERLLNKKNENKYFLDVTKPHENSKTYALLVQSISNDESIPDQKGVAYVAVNKDNCVYHMMIESLTKRPKTYAQVKTVPDYFSKIQLDSNRSPWKPVGKISIHPVGKDGVLKIQQSNQKHHILVSPLS